MNQKDRFLFLMLLLTAVLVRVIPHPVNISPLAALFLLASRELKSPLLALMLPLLVSFIGDYFLKFDSSALFVSLGFVFTSLLGFFLLRKNFRYWKLALASVFSSVGFFLISNFGVWFAGHLYPMDTAGLVRCYTLALPFLNRSLVSDLAFSFGLFAVFEIFRLLRRENVSTLERDHSNKV